MAARVCTTCQLNWPNSPEFKQCPNCHKRTTSKHAEDAMTAERARELLHGIFEGFYRERDAERERRGDPTPEAIGAMEARRQLEHERKAVEELTE